LLVLGLKTSARGRAAKTAAEVAPDAVDSEMAARLG
jgi:hypothetical protein